MKISSYIRGMKTKGNVLIVLILVISAVVRFYYAQNIIVINADEGNYLYDAYLISKGLTPFKDFLTRSPAFVYMLSFFVGALGNTLIAGRLLSIIAALTTTYFIFKIGTELYKPNIGLLASLIYAIAPFSVFWHSSVITEPVQVMWVTLAMYSLVKGLKDDDKKYYILNGLFISIAFLTRRSAAVFLLAEPILLLYLCRGDIKKVFSKVALIFIGVFTVLLPIVSYLVIKGFQVTNVIKIPGFSGLIRLFYPDQSIADMLYILFFTSSESLYLIFPIFIIFLYLFKRHILRNRLNYLHKPIWLGAGLLTLSMATYMFFSIPGLKPFITAFPVFISIFILLSFAMFFLSVVLSDSLKGFYQNEKHSFSNIFLVFWFASIMLFYVFYYKWHIHYFTELLPSASLISAVLIYSLFEQRIPWRKIFIILIIISMLLPHTQYILIGSHGMPISTAHKVSAYISEHVPENEEIFTATIFAYLSGRPLMLNLSHPSLYSYSSNPGCYPSINEVMEYMDSKEIRYVILDNYTKYCYFPKNPEFKKYIQSHYILEDEIEGVEIYVRDIEIMEKREESK